MLAFKLLTETSYTLYTELHIYICYYHQPDVYTLLSVMKVPHARACLEARHLLLITFRLLLCFDLSLRNATIASNFFQFQLMIMLPV